MKRWLMLLKHAWLIAWNLALLALLVGVPAVALWQAGWVATGFMLVLAAAVWLLRHPAFVLGMWMVRR
jgi:hypothetical protein